MTPDFLRAALRGDLARAGAVLGLRVPADEEMASAVLALRLQQLEDAPALQPWLLRAMRLRDTGEMVGYIGFHTAPDPEYLRPWAPGGIEFGCTVFAPHRRRGYADEAARALMDWARQAHGLRDFVTTTRPDNAPSQAWLRALGFARIGAHVDEDDGPEDILWLGAAPPADENEGLHIRPAGEQDWVGLSNLFTASVQVLGARSYTPAQVAAWAPTPPDHAGWARRFGCLQVELAQYGTQLAGFIARRGSDHVELLYTHPAHARRGVASALYRQMLARIGPQRCTLTTDASLEARPFFERQGWQVTGEEQAERNGERFRRFRMQCVHPGTAATANEGGR